MHEKEKKQLKSVESARWWKWKGRRTIEERICGKYEFWDWSGNKFVHNFQSRQTDEQQSDAETSLKRRRTASGHSRITVRHASMGEGYRPVSVSRCDAVW